MEDMVSQDHDQTPDIALEDEGPFLLLMRAYADKIESALVEMRERSAVGLLVRVVDDETQFVPVTAEEFYPPLQRRTEADDRSGIPPNPPTDDQ